MATVNVLQSRKLQTRAGLAFILSYCKRESKTIHAGRRLVSGVNCVADSAYQEMMNTKLQYGKTDGRMYYHFVQSFSPKENITPEMAHEIALKFAEQFQGYEVLVTTHVDREHIHSHFVVNSMSCETGRKYHSDKENIQKLRQVSDDLCLQYGLSVVTPKKKVKEMSTKEYHSAERGESRKTRLAVIIERAMEIAQSREHFILLMEVEGYSVKWTDQRKNITYTTPGGMRCRDDRLHEEKFLKEMMEYEFRIRKEITTGIERDRQTADAAGFTRRALRGGYRTELESFDQFTGHADSNAGSDPEWFGAAGNERADRRLFESADPSAAAVRGGERNSRGTVSERYEAAVFGIDPEDAERGEGDRSTGWEYERSIFQQFLYRTGYDEAVYEEAVLGLDDPFSDFGSLGIDAAYLGADLAGILEDDREIEDGTTIHYPHERKKNHGPTMGGL